MPLTMISCICANISLGHIDYDLWVVHTWASAGARSLATPSQLTFGGHESYKQRRTHQLSGLLKLFGFFQTWQSRRKWQKSGWRQEVVVKFLQNVNRFCLFFFNFLVAILILLSMKKKLDFAPFETKLWPIAELVMEIEDLDVYGRIVIDFWSANLQDAWLFPVFTLGLYLENVGEFVS